MVGEFKKFMLRGNVIDLAVGLVMGSAFGAIVTSLVNDIIMPVIGYATAGVSFVDLKIILAAAVMEGTEVVKPEVAIGYGKLIQVIINFILIGFSIFFIVKGINKMRARMEKPPEPAAPPAKPDDVVLLEEIRDLLKK
ncbi:MAG: large-conductance mechanosensitive channel protein MscL [Clostridiales bacterium]|jgi:large conductance mechanosensitive channel|nr:large-conductance mechanosensitive channel protein MscL [Clostridiales bacterium]